MMGLVLCALLEVSSSTVATSSTTQTSGIRCSPRACALYREAAIEWKAGAKKARAELAFCEDEQKQLELEHEKALDALAKTTAPAPDPNGAPWMFLAIALAVGVAGFAGGWVAHAH